MCRADDTFGVFGQREALGYETLSRGPAGPLAPRVPPVQRLEGQPAVARRDRFPW